MAYLSGTRLPDPVFQGDDCLWYFWDETWAGRHGPFQSEAEARKKFAAYLDYLDTGEIPDENNRH